MELGSVTHFSQGWPQYLIGEAAQLGITTIRDSVPWSRVERDPGLYDFSSRRLSYLDDAMASGLTVSLVFQPANELYDNGNTIYSDEAIAAFADFVLATLTEFEGVTRIEIGNEFNGGNFVSGPVKSGGLSNRADYYTAIIKAVDEALGEELAHVQVLGGAMHSIPVGYALKLAEAGALASMDAIAIHPYTTSPEQFAAQIGLLNAATGGMPIHVTEYGTQSDNPDEVAAFFVKMTTVMAAEGVEAAQWYSLYEQIWFQNMELIDMEGAITSTGKAFDLLADLLNDNDVHRLATQSDTHLYTIGENTLVMWGEPQEILFANDVTVLNATGQAIAFGGTLSFDAPLIVMSDDPLVLDDTVTLPGSGRIAHSAHDFDVDDSNGFTGAWAYFEERGTGSLKALETKLGQKKANEPWTPYIGGRDALRVTADGVRPNDFSGTGDPARSYAILERMTVTEDATATITARWDVQDTSEDGVGVEILHNGESIFVDVVFNPQNGHQLEITLENVALTAGDTLDFVVDPNGQSKGGDYTLRVYDIVRSAATPPDTALITHVGTNGKDTFNVAEGETVDGLGGRDTVNLADTGISFDLAAANVERANGGAGDDRLDGSGGAAPQRLNGGAGNDTLIGGANTDFLKGGEGTDVFVIGPGCSDDRILDFASGEDTLLIDPVLGDNAEAVRALAREVPKGVLLDFGDGDSVLLVRQTMHALTDDALIFA